MPSLKDLNSWTLIMPQCYVKTCKNYHKKTRSKVIYHMFPSSPDLSQKWTELCGHDKLISPPSYSRICSEHFSATAYRRDLQHELLGLPLRKKLKRHAVPDQNLSTKVNVGNESDRELKVVESEKVMENESMSCEFEFSRGKCFLITNSFRVGDMPQCAVANCNNTHRKTKGGSVRYHRFPGDPATRLRWLKACGRYVQNWATSRICSRHFSDQSYERDVQHELLGLPTRCRLKKGAIPEKNIPVIFVNKKEELSFNSSIAVLLAVGLVPRKGGGLPQDLNKMHVMEDVREGSDVPGAQPSSPGHAEQRSDVEEPQESNENSNESEVKPKIVQTNGTNEVESDANNIEESKTNEEEKVIKSEPMDSVESTAEKDCELEENSLQEDGASNDSNAEESQYSKRKLENEETSSKRLRSGLEQNYVIRDKVLSEYIDSVGCSSLQQIQNQTEQILAEIRTLNELAKEKEKEWNNIIHLKKVKEELLLRIQRRKQIILLNNDKIEWNDHESSTESNSDSLGGKNKQSLLKHKLTNSNNSGLMIFSTSSQGSTRTGSDLEKQQMRQKNSLKQYPNAVVELNGQLGDQKQKQRPVLDVQSIIADYRQRHPEAVPRRGRRIRSLLNASGDSSMVKKSGNGGVINFSSLLLGSGAQVKHNLNAAGIEANSELGLLLSSVEGKQSGKSNSDGNLDSSSFKDVLMQFAKLSQNERQDLLQTAMKPPPYSEVTVHPVAAHTQSTSNSLLHGILTKTQSRSDNSKSNFSPTLARLLTAPERAAAAAAVAPQANNTGAPVSISEMLSNNKARNEITITPVGGQFELNIKEKAATEEEEAEDSADRLVIDESDTLNDRNRMDNGSDAGDEVPQCQGCNLKAAQFVCAGCGNQWYCSRECQVVAWDEHSEVCSG